MLSFRHAIRGARHLSEIFTGADTTSTGRERPSPSPRSAASLEAYFSARWGRAVAQDGDLENRARAKAWAGPWTWPVGVTRPPWGAAWPRGGFAFVTQLRAWAAQELSAGRLLPWLPTERAVRSTSQAFAVEHRRRIIRRTHEGSARRINGARRRARRSGQRRHKQKQRARGDHHEQDVNCVLTQQPLDECAGT